ncbi:MAG: c-type cytochrome [Anaerolineaceae bacterium]|nr:c-type cytochrome [Anaerolineaceae bacterium]
MLKVSRSFLLFAALIMVLAACGGSSTPEAAPTKEPTAVPTEEPTAVPTEESAMEATEEPMMEATDEAMMEATEEAAVEEEVVGDPVKGQELFSEFRSEVNFACATCHYTDKEDQLVGPGMLGLGERAATRVSGMTATEYLRDSILHPSNHIVEGFPDLLMPQTFGDIFTDDQINDLIAYLKTL